MTPLSCARPRENVLVFSHDGDSMAESFGANSTAIVGKEGVLLVDPGIAPSAAREIERQLRARTPLPIVAVVLTHHHTDHALGAFEFARRNIPVYAHPEAIAAMTREHPRLLAERRSKPKLVPLFADAEPFAPSRAVAAETEIDLGQLSARVFPIGPAHTAGDLAIHVSSEGVLVTGDVVSNGFHVNYEDADLEGWRAALARMRRLDFEVLIPGHGAPSGRTQLELQLDYHDCIERIAMTGGVEEIKRRFPDFRLDLTLSDTVRYFSGRA